MRRVLIHGCLAAAVSCGASFVLSGPVGATTVPEDTEATGDTGPSDPELDAAVAVFEERMVDAGLANLGPAPAIEPDDLETDPDEYEQCAPEVRDVIASFEELGDLVAVGGAMATSDRFGPGAPTETAAETATTTDPFSALLAGTEEVLATAQRLDASEIEAVDQAIELAGSPGFAECLETVMTASMGMSDAPTPEMTDLSMPELSDLSIPDMPDLSMPDLSMPDLSMPDLSSMPGFEPEIEVTPAADLGLGDASAGFSIAMSMLMLVPMDLAIETVIVRTGDVLVTVSHSRLNGTGEPIDVDLAAEAGAIVDAL